MEDTISHLSPRLFHARVSYFYESYIFKSFLTWSFLRCQSHVRSIFGENIAIFEYFEARLLDY